MKGKLTIEKLELEFDTNEPLDLESAAFYAAATGMLAELAEGAKAKREAAPAPTEQPLDPNTHEQAK